MATVKIYAEAGDGQITSTNAVWNTAHDATTGSANAAITSFNVQSRHDGSTYRVSRVFVPFDTTSIPNGAIITAATLNLYVIATSNTDNDGDDWVNVVQTDQASTATLDNDDINNCGAVDNPTEGATRIDIGNITLNQYNVWTLNSTGLTWINKNGNTLLGLREGHDAIDSPIGTNLSDRIGFSSTEETGTTQDPYLEITYITPQINISDAWKNVEGIQINIGDAWKAVSSMKTNIGDTWKTIF